MYMKKLLAVVLTLALCMMSVASLAETAAPEMPAGEMIAIEEYELQAFLPEGWTRVELTQEQKDGGMVFQFASADQTASIAMSYALLENEMTNEAYLEALKAEATIKDASIQNLQDYPVVAYETTEGVGGFAAISGTTLLNFTFSPLDNADMLQLFGVIVGSVLMSE